MPNETYYDNPILGKNAKDDWPQEEMKKWEKWDYEKGFVIENRSAARPWRQKRAGLPYGLSLLIDSNAGTFPIPSDQWTHYLCRFPTLST